MTKEMLCSNRSFLILYVTTIYKTQVCKMDVRQLNEIFALTVTVVSSAFFITSLLLDTTPHSEFVVNNFPAENNNILPSLHRILCN
jgi:hypothetical protein